MINSDFWGQLGQTFTAWQVSVSRDYGKPGALLRTHPTINKIRYGNILLKIQVRKIINSLNINSITGLKVHPFKVKKNLDGK